MYLKALGLKLYYQGNFTYGKITGTGKIIELNNPERVSSGVFDSNFKSLNATVTKLGIKKNLYDGTYKGSVKEFFTPDGNGVLTYLDL